MKRLFLLFAGFSLALLLLLLPVLIVSASPSHDRIVLAGEQVGGDINLNDDLIVEADGVVTGNVHVFSGNAEIAGTVTGNLLVFNGDVVLTETSHVGGDCVVAGGSVVDQRAHGECTSLAQSDIGLPNNIVWDWDDGGGGGSTLRALGSTLIFAALAFAVAAAAPRRLHRIEDAIAIKPVASGTVGVLTFIAASSLIVLLTLISALLTIVCIGLLGFPVVLALGALLGGGLLLGYIAVGNIVGQMMQRALRLSSLSLPLQAALGTALLSLALGVIRILPIAGGFSASLASLIIASIGLGAVALTRFGAQPYPRFLVSKAQPEPEQITISYDDLS